MNTTIDLVAILVAVGEAASFSAAARRLGVTTGTVSRSIARLEAQLGTQLVHRTTRQVSLSTAGQALFERAASHVRGIEAAVKNLPERQREPAGTLRLTAAPDFGVTILPAVIARYVSLYPQVRVDCDLSNRNVDLVADGFDLALRASGDRQRDSALVIRRLMAADLRFYAAPTYVARRGTPRDLGDLEHDWVGLVQMRKHLTLPASFAPRIVGNDMLFVREATRAGAGIGLLPNFFADPLVALGELVAVLPRMRFKWGGIVLLYPSSGQVPRKVTAFRDVLLATLNGPHAP